MSVGVSMSAGSGSGASDDDCSIVEVSGGNMPGNQSGIAPGG